jgi:hypothetical protein
MRNRNYDMMSMMRLDRWDLPVFRRRNPETLNCASPRVFILEVIYISIRYWILFIIMYAGRAVVGMPDHRIEVVLIY